MKSMFQTSRRAVSASDRRWCAFVVAVALVGCATTVEASSTRPAPGTSTKVVAWSLGSKLSLAALGYDQGGARTAVDSLLTKSRALAAEVGVTVPDLPPKSGNKARDSADVVHYLLVDAGQPIAHAISQRYGAEHAALFEVALKSNLLLLLYAPGERDATAIAAIIKQRGPEAGLPDALWKPVVDKVEALAPYDDVKAAVIKMHDDVFRLLSSAG